MDPGSLPVYSFTGTDPYLLIHDKRTVLASRVTGYGHTGSVFII
jgi:hypothetical protein